MIDIPLENNVPSHVVGIAPGRSVHEALQMMNAYKSSYVLVVENGKSLGIITERDMTVLLEDGFSGANWHDLTVEHIMTSPVVTVSSDAYLLEAIEIMRGLKIRHAPMLDSRGVTVGVVTPQVVIDLLYRNWSDG